MDEPLEGSIDIGFIWKWSNELKSLIRIGNEEIFVFAQGFSWICRLEK